MFGKMALGEDNAVAFSTTRISTSYSFPVTDFCFDGQCGFFCLPKL